MSNNINNPQRRDFLKTAGLGFFAAPFTIAFAKTLLTSATANAADKVKFVDVNDAAAKAMGYVEDAAKAGKGGKECYKCLLYVFKGKKEEIAKGPGAACKVLPGKGDVKHMGTCNSFSKNPAIS